MNRDLLNIHLNRLKQPYDRALPRLTVWPGRPRTPELRGQGLANGPPGEFRSFRFIMQLEPLFGAKFHRTASDHSKTWPFTRRPLYMYSVPRGLGSFGMCRCNYLASQCRLGTPLRCALTASALIKDSGLATCCEAGRAQVSKFLAVRALQLREYFLFKARHLSISTEKTS